MQADFRTSVENEWLCSKIMELFGLSVARSAILQFDDQKVLAVERFDRKNSDDQGRAGLDPLDRRADQGYDLFGGSRALRLVAHRKPMYSLAFFKFHAARRVYSRRWNAHNAPSRLT